MNKRGQADFRLPLVVLTGVAAFVLTAIIVLLVVGTVNDAEVFGGAPTTSHTVTNESDNTGNIAYINTTGYTLSRVNASNSDYAITAIWVNITDGVPYLLGSGNNTVSAAGVVTNQSVPLNATQWNNASISYTYTETYAAPLGQLATGNLTGNVTSGVNVVSAKLSTVFVVAAVIFLVMIIAVLVAVWSRFRSNSLG